MSAGCSPGSEKPVLVSRAITRQPAVNYADAPAALGLRRSVGHRPLVAPPAGFQRGGDPRYLANPRGLRVWALSRIPTVRLGDSQFRGVPRGQGWCAGRPRFRFPRSRFQCRRNRSWFARSGSRRCLARRPGRFMQIGISRSHHRQYIPVVHLPVLSCAAGLAASVPTKCLVMRKQPCGTIRRMNSSPPSVTAIEKNPRVIFCTSQECLRTSEFNRAAVHTVGVCSGVYRFTRIRSSLGCRSATGGV